MKNSDLIIRITKNCDLTTKPDIIKKVVQVKINFSCYIALNFVEIISSKIAIDHLNNSIYHFKFNFINYLIPYNFKFQ